MSSNFARTLIFMLLLMVGATYLLMAPGGYRVALGTGYFLRDIGQRAASVPFFYVASLNYPQSHLPHWGLGTMIADLGYTASSLAHFRRAVAIKPDWDRACWPATRALEVNDLVAAQELIRLGMNNDPKEMGDCIINYLTRLTWSDFKAATHRRALAESGVLIATEPENWLWWETRRRLWERRAGHIRNKALSAIQISTEQQALVESNIRDAEALVQKFPHSVEAKRYFLNSGRAALIVGQYKDARDWFVEGSKHDPSLLEKQAAFYHRDDGGRSLGKSLTESDGLIRVDPQNVMWWKLRHDIWRLRVKHVEQVTNDCRQRAVLEGVHEQQFADAEQLVELYPDNTLAQQYRMEVRVLIGKARELCNAQRG